MLVKNRLDNSDIGEFDISSGADLRWADLRWADLHGADLCWANLSGADLSGANLRGVDLSGADLSGADLSGVELSRADLRWVDLSRADLRWANLSRADLSGADLSGADLRWADLRWADLSGANGNFCVGYFGKHHAIAAGGYISIGCERHTYQHWIGNYKVIGKQNGYTAHDIAMYGAWIRMATKHLSKIEAEREHAQEIH